MPDGLIGASSKISMFGTLVVRFLRSRLVSADILANVRIEGPLADIEF